MRLTLIAAVNTVLIIAGIAFVVTAAAMIKDQFLSESMYLRKADWECVELRRMPFPRCDQYQRKAN
jgi:hypothetical protein